MHSRRPRFRCNYFLQGKERIRAYKDRQPGKEKNREKSNEAVTICLVVVVPIVAQWVAHSVPEDAGLIPGLAQQVKDLV